MPKKKKYFKVLFWGISAFNSGLWACYTGALLLESFIQPFFALVIGDRVSFFAHADLDHNLMVCHRTTDHNPWLSHQAQLFLLRWGLKTDFFGLGWPGTTILLISISHIVYSTAFRYWLRWESHELFCPGWSWTMILPISASPVARITGVSLWCLALKHFLYICYL
jgi:hypothetical protein